MSGPLFFPGGTQMSENPTPIEAILDGLIDPANGFANDGSSQLPSGCQPPRPSLTNPFSSMSQQPGSQFANTHTQAPRLPKKMRMSDDGDESQAQAHLNRPPIEGEEGTQAAEDKSIVGVLLGDIEGIGPARVVIRVGRIILIGRSPANDVTLNYPTVSRRHLRLTPVRTSTSLTTVSLSDMSSYGFYLNGTFHRPDRVAKIDHNRLRCKTYILNENDKIRLPGCPTVFTYHHGLSHCNALSEDDPVELFTTADQPRYLLGTYWVVHNFHLGDGAFGVVNLASHRTAAWFQVACKTVKVHAKATKEDKQRHINEVNVLKRINHPNVNCILDLIREEEHWHMILELMAGGDLFAYHEKHAPLPEMEVKWIGFQLVQGLGHLHQMDIAHRDIKPENILLATSAMYPRVVIGDFGHAIDYQGLLEKTPKSDHEALKREVPHIGTSSFMPPERIKMWLRPPGTLKGMFEDLPAVRGKDGKTAMTRRQRLAYMWLNEEKNIDSWGLGVTLFTTATHHHPYDERSPTASQSQRPPSRKLTSAQSWSNFRQGTRMMSALGGSGVTAEEFTKLKALYEGGCQLAPYLFESSKFKDFSKEGKQFLRTLLEPKADKRLQISAASKHEWFRSHQGVLDALWHTVVVKGDILHRDTAAALIGKNTDEDEKEVPQSQAGDAHSPIESVNTYGRKRGPDEADDIEDSDETPLIESRDDIEVDQSLISASGQSNQESSAF